MKTLDVNNVHNVNYIELNVNKTNSKDAKITKRYFNALPS